MRNIEDSFCHDEAHMWMQVKSDCSGSELDHSLGSHRIFWAWACQECLQFNDNLSFQKCPISQRERGHNSSIIPAA